MLDGEVELPSVAGPLIRIDADHASAGIVGQSEIQRWDGGETIADASGDIPHLD